MTSPLYVAVAIGVSLSAGQVLPTTPTIRELVAASDGKPMRKLSVIDPQYISLDDLSKKSHLIVIGKLVKPKGYLTPNDRDIFTDYELSVSQMVIDRASVGVAPRIGQLPVITVTLHGGDIVLNGVNVSLKEASQVQWKEGSDLFLFLVRSGSKDKPNNFIPYGNAAGVFEVTTAGLKALVSGGWSHDEIDGVPVDQMVQKVRARAEAPATSDK